jgi:hypothetical protein
MGLYNSFSGVQLKLEKELYLKYYDIGDKVDLNDGLYLGADGFVVIHKKRLFKKYDFLMNSHGNCYNALTVYQATLSTIDKLKDIKRNAKK